MDLRIPLGRPQVTQGLVSCAAMKVRSPLDQEKQFHSSCQVDHRDRGLCLNGLSHLPSCFELVLGVTVKSGQGSQGCLECNGISGNF